MSQRTLPKTRSFIWKKNHLVLLDQRLLPHKVVWLNCRTWPQAADGIRLMVVRGAPAIGCVAAYGIVLAARSRKFKALEEQRRFLSQAFEGLLKARPTAVNLRWGLQRMRRIWEQHAKNPDALAKRLE